MSASLRSIVSSFALLLCRLSTLQQRVIITMSKGRTAGIGSHARGGQARQSMETHRPEPYQAAHGYQSRAQPGPPLTLRSSSVSRGRPSYLPVRQQSCPQAASMAILNVPSTSTTHSIIHSSQASSGIPAISRPSASPLTTPTHGGIIPGYGYMHVSPAGNSSSSETCFPTVEGQHKFLPLGRGTLASHRGSRPMTVSHPFVQPPHRAGSAARTRTAPEAAPTGPDTFRNGDEHEPLNAYVRLSIRDQRRYYKDAEERHNRTQNSFDDLNKALQAGAESHRYLLEKLQKFRVNQTQSSPHFFFHATERAVSPTQETYSRACMLLEQHGRG